MGDRIRSGSAVTAEQEREAAAVKAAWLRELNAVFVRVQAIALPTLSDVAPPLDAPTSVAMGSATIAFNLSGSPALAVPLPLRGTQLMASVQLVGPLSGEESLLTLGARIESAAGIRR